MNTREIAEKLFAYAEWLESRKNDISAQYRVLHRDEDAELHNAYEAEEKQVRDMANILWDKKETL